MRKMALIGAAVIGTAILSASPVSMQWSAERNLSVTQDKAFAEIGRPATPGSVAGVHRRTERRALRRGRNLSPLSSAGVALVRTPVLISAAAAVVSGRIPTSDGCVSFRNYEAFLQAYLDRKITKLAVVSSLD